MEQWGLWLGREIDEFEDKNERLEIQSHITTYIAQMRRKNQ